MTTLIRSPRTRGLRRAVTAGAAGLFVFSPGVRAAQAQQLEPPPPISTGAPYGPYPPYAPSTTASSLPPSVTSRPSQDEEDDSGLGLEWVWLNADLGGAYANMQSFSASTFALQKTESGGPMFGVGAGVRLLFFTLGVRVRDLQLSSIGSLWQLDVEAGFHTRIWRIDPYFGVRGGYDFVGSLNASSVQVAAGGSPSDVSVHGFNMGPMVGIDYYFRSGSRSASMPTRSFSSSNGRGRRCLPGSTRPACRPRRRHFTASPALRSDWRQQAPRTSASTSDRSRPGIPSCSVASLPPRAGSYRRRCPPFSLRSSFIGATRGASRLGSWGRRSSSARWRPFWRASSRTGRPA